MSIQNQIEQRLHDILKPSVMEVLNESHMHNVPPDSESHFKVTVVSDAFEGLTLINRHRMVNSALQNEMKKIHALALHTLTQDEWFERAGRVADSPLCEGGAKNQ